MQVWPGAASGSLNNQHHRCWASLNSGSPEAYAPFVTAFHEGLKENGFVAGSNITIEYRWALGRYDRLPVLAEELVTRRVAVIVAAGGALPGQAAKAATQAIPIVFLFGGNATGLSLLTIPLEAKRSELLREIIPNGSLLAVLLNPAQSERRDLLEAVGTTWPRLSIFHASAAIYEWREFVAVGGLTSYGTSLTGAYRDVGRYAGLILKGAEPAALPVLQPTRFELVLNLATAKALGITIPPAILLRADEVIE